MQTNEMKMILSLLVKLMRLSRDKRTRLLLVYNKNKLHNQDFYVFTLADEIKIKKAALGELLCLPV